MTQRAPHPLTKLTRRMLPFADAASRDLPIGQLLRLSLFQVSVGLASVMLLGTLNRVMIVELSVPAMIVAIMIALPVLIAPFRALIGFRSDTYRSAIGWKRVPFIWFGSLWQMGGLAVMPFALLVLSGDQTVGPSWAGEVLAALAFLMTGLGLHMTQTAGLALASDRASRRNTATCRCPALCDVFVGYGPLGAFDWMVVERFHQPNLDQSGSRRSLSRPFVEFGRSLETRTYESNDQRTAFGAAS